MIRIAIAGAAGRMGQTLIKALAPAADSLQLTAATVLADDPALGMDVGLAAVGRELGVVAEAGLAPAVDRFDVLIDFTTPAASLANLVWCEQHHKAMVLGTTGFDAAELDRIHAVSAVPLVFAPNMSIGVNLCFNLLQQVAEVLGDAADIDIIEAHHRYKRDAPSGTALKMGELIADKLGRKLAEVAVYGRVGVGEQRDAASIGFSSIRAGDIVGEHSVRFAALGESLEISHRASSRMTFARGALRAAGWVRQQQPGMYSMLDVLGLADG